MMGQQNRTESLFYYFRLEEQIPADHLLRMIDGHVDFSFVREQLKDSYSLTGRPTIDPEVLLRLSLVGYLYGITSERRLMDEVRMHLAYRWFTRLGFDQEIPDHSTLSKNRHGRFRQSGVFRKVFEEVVWPCLEAGFVEGRNVAVDGTLVGANASQQSRVPRERLEEVAKLSRTVLPQGSVARFRREHEASRESVDDRSRCCLGYQKGAGGVGLLRQLSGRHDEPSHFVGPFDASPVQSRNIGRSSHA
jgi:transposase